STGDLEILVREDRPAVEEARKLPRREVVDLFALLPVDHPIGEDDVGMEATRGGEDPEPPEEALPVTPRKMVHGAAGGREIETPCHRGLEHRSTEPSPLELPFIGQPTCLGQGVGRDIEPRHFEASGGEVDAVASLPASEIQDAGAGG